MFFNGMTFSFISFIRTSQVVGLNKVGVSKCNKLRAHCWAVSLSPDSHWCCEKKLCDEDVIVTSSMTAVEEVVAHYHI